MGTKMHLALSVRGALRNRDLRGFANTDGLRMSEDDVFEFLCDQLKLGHELIPMSGSCEGFDPFKNGCPGHDIPDEALRSL